MLIDTLRETYRRLRGVVGPPDTAGVSGRIELERYDARDVDAAIWSRLGIPPDAATTRERLQAQTYVEPLSASASSNVALDQWLDRLAQTTDSNTSVQPIQTTHFAVGTDGSTPAASDTGLGNEVYRDPVDSTTVNGSGITITGTVPSGSANGNTIREACIVDDAEAIELNRANVGPESKVSGVELTINAQLTFDQK